MIRYPWFAVQVGTWLVAGFGAALFARASASAAAVIVDSTQTCPSTRPPPWISPHGRQLSQQSCNTQCQSVQTDCALRCDQEPDCIGRCRAKAEDCTKRCIQGQNPAPTPASYLHLQLVEEYL
ncbi:MAG TPA: hypothetical protein VKP30_23905 [Polyangiaceae bacterium]|nr:hypothetical protein [Polyangiaceae bacterium]